MISNKEGVMLMTRKQAEQVLMPINKKCTVNDGIILFLPDSNTYILLKHGESDALTEEDYDAGNNDYIYISSYKCGSYGFEEFDGGYFLFNDKDYQGTAYNITNFVFDCIWLISEMQSEDVIPGFIPLHLVA